MYERIIQLEYLQDDSLFLDPVRRLFGDVEVIPALEFLHDLWTGLIYPTQQ